MFTQHFKLIVPMSKNASDVLLPSAVEDKIECYSGNRVVNNFGLTASGSGTWVNGTISGTLNSYDYKALYDVYHISDYTESANYWFISYKKDISHDELVKTFEDSKTVALNYNLNFTIQGNDYGINDVFICYETIRLVVNGVTKDFVVSNPASASALSPDGNPYPGGFKPA